MMIYDIYFLVSQYLCFVDRLIFKMMNKETINIPNNFKLDFCKKIKNFINDPEEFCQQLKNNNTYIAGSFILDVLYATNFANDIDIYEGDDKCINYYDTEFKEFGESKLKFLQYIYSLNLERGKFGNHYSDPELYYGPIYMIRNYKIKNCNTELQHIIVRSKKVLRFIDNSFDLDICKCNFDGERLRIKDLNKII